MTLAGFLAACGGAEATPTSGAGVAATPASTGTKAAAGTKGGTLIVAFDSDPESLDPHITTNLMAERVLAVIHNSLIERDYDSTFKPGLAEKWEISPDGKTYTFALKKGVKWHSGKDFAAEDVKYTFERWLANEKAPNAYKFKPIDKIETPDPLTVRFLLKEPYNIFLDQLASNFAVMLNKDVVEKAGKDYGVATVDGTGPFKFVSWTRGQKLVVTRNEAYTWGSPMFQNQGPAYLDGIEFRPIPEDNTRIAEFQSGNLHIVNNVPNQEVERLAKTNGLAVVKYDQINSIYMGINTSKAPFNDVRVRRAINHALNKDDIVKGAFFGLATPAKSMLTPDTPYYWKGTEQAAPTYDVAKASALLDEAGWKQGAGGIREKDGKQLVLPLWHFNTNFWPVIPQIIAEQLAKVGIKVETKQYEGAAMFAALRTGEQVAYVLDVYFDTADTLYFFFYSKQQPSPNRFMYNVPEVDKWLDESRSNTDKAAVALAYENVQKRLNDDLPYAPLLAQVGTLGVSAKVQGVKVHPSRWLYRFSDISLKQ